MRRLRTQGGCFPKISQGVFYLYPLGRVWTKGISFEFIAVKFKLPQVFYYSSIWSEIILDRFELKKSETLFK